MDVMKIYPVVFPSSGSVFEYAMLFMIKYKQNTMIVSQ